MHWGWAYDGVNSSIPRNTGPECVNYLSTTRHIIESVILIPMAILTFRYGLSKLPSLHINYQETNHIVFGKQILLITMTALLGLEMGFKLCTRTAIYILNPCHVTSMLQVYLLAAKPSRWTTTLFRIHINYLNGPLLAFLFPEHDSRKITFELPTYYVQHGLMIVIPIYLIRHGGPYVAEKLTDFSYSIAAYGIFIFYHFGFLEFFAVSAQVNLNHMICPAILDPFQGANYRLNACLHQALLCPIISKCLAYILSPPTKPIENRSNEIAVEATFRRSIESEIMDTSKDATGSSLVKYSKLVNIEHLTAQVACRVANSVSNNEQNVDSLDVSTDENQIKNGCDKNSSDAVSMLHSNSDKKMQ